MAVANTAPTRLTYSPGLDGLRAIAIIVVMLFHLKTKTLFPGGGIGVDLFFVLSGFLITTLLLQEWQSNGRISLLRFYHRRALRLLPALLLFLSVYCLVAVAFQDSSYVRTPAYDRLLAHVVGVLSYSYNWLIAVDAPRAPGLSHLWSLSVEEQFYVVWPVCLLALLRLRLTPRARMLMTALVMAASAALPYIVEVSSSRIYYGTDFRLQSLLWGSLLGQMFVAGVLRPSITGSAGYRIAFVVAALFLTWHVLTRSMANPATPVAVASGVLVLVALLEERSVTAKLLSNGVLVYVGKRSYALYLWHAAFNSWLFELSTVPSVILVLCLSFVAAELSYRLVERPALRAKDRFKTPAASKNVAAAVSGTFSPRHLASLCSQSVDGGTATAHVLTPEFTTSPESVR